MSNKGLTLWQRAHTFFAVDKPKNKHQASKKVKIGKYKGWHVSRVPEEYMRWYLSNYDLTKKRRNFCKYEQRTTSLFIQEMKRRIATRKNIFQFHEHVDESKTS